MNFIRYLRDEDGRPFGCVVAVVEDSRLPIWGASLCNPKDRFCRSRAREIAIGRAMKHGWTDGALVYNNLPSDRAVALRNAVRLVEADIQNRLQWAASHPAHRHAEGSIGAE